MMPHHTVRNFYDRLAQSLSSGADRDVQTRTRAAGYTPNHLEGLPTLANLGSAGCNLFQQFGYFPRGRVLDLGCGAGLDVLLLAKQNNTGTNIMGIDVSREMIARATTSRAQLTDSAMSVVEFLESDVDHVEFPTHSIDAVICQRSLKFFQNYPATMTRISEWLKPGGQFLGAEWVTVHDADDCDSDALIPPLKFSELEAHLRRLFTGGLELQTLTRRSEELLATEPRRPEVAVDREPISTADWVASTQACCGSRPAHDELRPIASHVTLSVWRAVR